MFNKNIDPNKPGISFIGRLGTYRYLDMEKVISESLDFSKIILNNLICKEDIPTFIN